MPQFSYDLHTHSALSPCGDKDNTPCNIAGMAAVQELDIIALCDHNTARNCPACKKACEEYGVLFIPGMELTTAEEVHVVCLFPALDNALAFDKEVYKHLIKVKNNPEIFGAQEIYDENDNVIDIEPNLLINATDIDFARAFLMANEFGGVAMPAHIDKSANSLFSNLGFIPPECSFKTVEINNYERFNTLKEKFPYLKDCLVLKDSDAHYLGNVSAPNNKIELDFLTHNAVIEKIKKGK